MNDFNLLDPARIRDISSEVLGENGRLKILPASYWATTSKEERTLFGHRSGIYSFPTLELVDFLKGLIGSGKAIEIGAGNGVLSEALEIVATDSFQQNQPKYKAYYRSIKHPTVPYGPNVIECTANRAVRKYRPDVVIGCWITHKYDVRRHSAGGNEAGVVEEEILTGCKTYVHIGNEKVHKGKSIWDKPHEIIYPNWLYSRAGNDTRDCIAIWS